jgi:transposase InsO family protein
MDFKGHFPLLQGRCHPLTVLDDHSRFNLVLQACANEQRQTVQRHLQTCFERYGRPRRLQTDNGPPWGCSGQGPLTQLGVWLIRLGIRLSPSRPLHPQSNGKEERFHRSLKAEVLSERVFADLTDVQSALDRWRAIYNQERPHEGIGMQTPGERYRASERTFPAHLPPIEYGPEDSVRKVSQGGSISFRGQEIQVSKAWVGFPIALRPQPQKDGCFDLFFCHHKFDSIDLALPPL